MTKTLLIPLLAAVAMMLASPSEAACYADYKAKRDNPLRLHYGVIELPDAACASRQAAWQEISARLARSDWTLLSVVSVFGESGLNARKRSAGDFFLRF